MIEGEGRRRLKKKTAKLLIGGLFVCGVSIAMYFVIRNGLAPQRATKTLPGAKAMPSALLRKFEEKIKELGPDYKPRTRHLNPDGYPTYTNRLFLESSPYLLQHAHNPVNWYPWGDEAFAAAKARNVPVLLSVGYSTCHWCHVMEEESFEDEAIAAKLNEHYIAIKVDREERPDIDAIYMAAVQAMTGGGGWPMTVWLTPDRKPFYGGTYFPARDGDRGASTGFLTILAKIKEIYASSPERVAESARQLSEAIRANLSQPGGSELPDRAILKNVFDQYSSTFDSTHGGLSRSPKFPSSLPIRFLLRYAQSSTEAPAQRKKAIEMTKLTLDKMASGGMYDQIGGGFHRYSTDAKWLVPHFEKMLYDNALLVLAYLDAFQATHDENYSRVVRETLRYVERDMSSPEGGFFSATDADSLGPSGHREEGYFFTWTKNEIQSVLSPEHARVVIEYYNVTNEGHLDGRSILHVTKPLTSFAKKLQLSPERISKLLEEAKERLQAERKKRPPPLRDEKILTSWNGLMITAFARAGMVLADPQYIVRAEKAANFALKNLYKGGRLLHVFKDGKAKIGGYLDDYSFFLASLLDLFEATGNPTWFAAAKSLDANLEDSFEDKDAGGFFMASAEHDKLIVREKPGYDGAEPSGNSVSLMNLLRLLEFTTDDHYRQRAERSFKFFSRTLRQAPTALSEMLSAVDFYLDKPKEIVIVSPQGSEASALRNVLRENYLPNRVLVITEEGSNLEAIGKLIPLVQGKTAMNGKATAYVCEKGVCRLPTSDLKEFQAQIRGKMALGDSN